MCLKESELQWSHAIPNSFFKKLFKKNNGNAIFLSTSDAENIRLSSESFAQYQLCFNCEQLLSNNYEGYAISAFRGKGINVTRNEDFIKFDLIDSRKIRLFLLSIAWRVSRSSHPALREISIQLINLEKIRIALLKNTDTDSKVSSIKISRLVDSTENGFSLDQLKQIIISPFKRRFENRNQSICFILEGFFIEIFTPGIKTDNSQQGFLLSENNCLEIPYIEILSIPEMVAIFIQSISKHRQGKINF